MAGIGFVLEKLMRQDDLTGVLRGIAYAAVIATGPWLITVFSLAAVTLLVHYGTASLEVRLFHSVIIYNFSASLVMTGPIALVTTRFLADRIFLGKVEPVPATLLTGSAACYGLALLIGIPFYGFVCDLPLTTALAAIVNLAAVCGIWYVGVFLSALRDYRTIFIAFLVGLTVGAVTAIALSRWYGTDGMLFGFSTGIVVLVFIAKAKILAEYPYKFVEPFAVLPYFRTYWPLALGGLVFNAAVWIDKWIMWFAPERVVVGGALATHPYYDGAMFLAYLTVVPSLAMFLVSVETAFFRVYQRFYRAIAFHATYAEIEDNRLRIVRTLATSSRDIAILQAAVTMLALFLAPAVIELTASSFQQIGILRFGILGAYFQAMLLFLSTLLAYFDLRLPNLGLQTLFLVTNGLFTLASLEGGFEYYGYGFFASTVVTCAVGFVVLSHALSRLPYLAFIGSNPSVE
ncbi:exopolysaccharide Pel transporter PelG [Marinibaculum pumilum]|uniref:Exopolysaccharide Pel transporter PelG n=1 Tax=Marinibaculum pumilum TaxID=1766165 RepID=A0ABV7KWT5_9PROT